MPVDIVLGLQWGDEGKGKIVDFLSPNYAYVARFQGGPNAGHTIYANGVKHILHQIPSGIFHEGPKCVVGNGALLDPVALAKEIAALEDAGLAPAERLIVSDKAHLILPTHPQLDRLSEEMKGAAKIGSTLRGIRPAYQDKYGRAGLRAGDLLRADFEEKARALMRVHQELLRQADVEVDLDEMALAFLSAVDKLRSLAILPVEKLLHDELKQGKAVLAEGAQGTLLDVEFGAYPYVTSCATIAGGACTGLGVSPRRIREIIGVFKAYCTRVGNGPFPTELDGVAGQQLRDAGNEYGSTTGRPRRCGWLDVPALKYAIDLNGVTRLAITKVDILSNLETFDVCTRYQDGQFATDDFTQWTPDGMAPKYETFKTWYPGDFRRHHLPPELNRFVVWLEEQTETRLHWVSSGPEREALIARK